jgi:hypothetical protein
MVICLTAAKFKLLIFSMLGFALSNIANIPVLQSNCLATSYKDAFPMVCRLYSFLRQCVRSRCLAMIAFLYCYINGPYIKTSWHLSPLEMGYFIDPSHQSVSERVARWRLGKHVPAKTKNFWRLHFLCSLCLMKESRQSVLPTTSC